MTLNYVKQKKKSLRSESKSFKKVNSFQYNEYLILC